MTNETYKKLYRDFYNLIGLGSQKHTSADTEKAIQRQIDAIEKLLSEQKRLILEEGEMLFDQTNDPEAKPYNRALTDYQDRIKQL